MERTAPHPSESDEHGVFTVAVVVLGQHLDVTRPRLDLGRADEDPGDGSETLHLDGRFETRDLASVAVSPYRHRQGPETPLITSSVEDLRAEQDQPRAGTKDAQTVREALFEGPSHPRGDKEVGNGGRLPSGQYEAVQIVELIGPPYEHGVGPELFEHVTVFCDVALQGEHANARHYQPRPAAAPEPRPQASRCPRRRRAAPAACQWRPPL